MRVKMPIFLVTTGFFGVFALRHSANGFFSQFSLQRRAFSAFRAASYFVSLFTENMIYLINGFLSFLHGRSWCVAASPRPSLEAEQSCYWFQNDDWFQEIKIIFLKMIQWALRQCSLRADSLEVNDGKQFFQGPIVSIRATIHGKLFSASFCEYNSARK